MGYTFKVQRIIELLMEAEKKGQEFYAEQARSVYDTESRHMFEILSGLEKKHYRMLDLMKGNVSREEKEYVVDLEEIITVQRDKLIKFLQEKEYDHSGVTVVKVLEIAADFEKESVEVYTRIRDILSREFEEIFSTIIDEEKYHLEMIEKHKNKISREKAA